MKKLAENWPICPRNDGGILLRTGFEYSDQVSSRLGGGGGGEWGGGGT